MCKKDIEKLVNAINEALNLSDGDYGFLSVVDEKGQCKVVYGKSSALNLTGLSSYESTSNSLASILDSLHESLAFSNSMAFIASKFFEDKTKEPAFIKGYLESQEIGKFYAGCNLSLGEEYHRNNNAIVIVDGIDGRIVETYGELIDIEMIKQSIDTSQYYLALRVMALND